MADWPHDGEETLRPKNPAMRKAREDSNQIAYGVMQEVIKKSEAWLGFGISGILEVYECK